MQIIEVPTNKYIDVVISALQNKDFQTIKRAKQNFIFDWGAYKSTEVFKLTLLGSDEILGLISLIDHTEPETNAIEINLLEASRENVGRFKRFEGIAGCLLSFACRESFKRGHDGVVFLIPKSELIGHYNRVYGFELVPLSSLNRPLGFMILDTKPSQALIRKYADPT